MQDTKRSAIGEHNSLTEQLKAKSRNRRGAQAQMQAAALARDLPRNDFSPHLTLIDLPLDLLRMPARKVRSVEEAHVQEIARAISSLGFCAPILIGKDNLVLDGQTLDALRSRAGPLRSVASG